MLLLPLASPFPFLMLHKESTSNSRDLSLSFVSHGLLMRWSPFMGCCRRDLRPAMDPSCPPAGWAQLPNCGLAPAGRSGVGSWDNCLDILWPDGEQLQTPGALQGGEASLQKNPPMEVCRMAIPLQSLVPFSALEKYFYPSAPWQLRGSKCCADYSKRSETVGGTVAPETILSIINATAVKCNKRPMD